MSELSRLSQALVDRPLVEPPEVGALRARARRRRKRRAGALSVVLALAVLSALGVARLSGAGSERGGQAHLAAYFEAAVAVPDATLSAVGLPPSVSVPARVGPVPATTSSEGTVSYVGAEYCPFCALERWALLVALSKFGTFSHLSDAVFSSSTDVYPHLASWSFVGARYSSPYFGFRATELYSSTPNGKGGYKALQVMTPPERAAFGHYDPQGSLPFVDIGDRYVNVGSSSSPSVLEGLSLAQIGHALANPSSPVAKAVDGSANYLIAAMCQVVQGTKPAICSSPTTAEALGALSSGVAPKVAASPGQPPVQPPENAPMSVWRRWSEETHRYLEEQVAHGFAKANPGCVVTKAAVTGNKLTKPTLGVPAGVTIWAIDLTGNCRRLLEGKK
ncbi:MAG: DUF929 family protein [Actinomycetota bacterium]|jgi:hypothetical protein|nr:DUF929 family protein [Actinomycetota bacterium]